MRVRPACVPTVGRRRCGDDERESKVEIQLCRLPACPRTLRLLSLFSQCLSSDVVEST